MSILQAPRSAAAAAAPAAGPHGDGLAARLQAAAARGAYRELIATCEARTAAAPEDEAARLELAQALFQADDPIAAQPHADWVTRFAQDWNRRVAAWQLSIAAAPYLPELDVLDLRALAQRWSGHLMARRVGLLPPAPAPRPAGRQLRVGFLLTDLPAGTRFLPLAGEAGGSFAAAGYWLGAAPCPAPGLADLSALPPVQAAARIRQDNLDILLDLSPAGSGHADLLMLLRPARVQVGWINRLLPDYDPGHDWLLGDALLLGGSDFVAGEGVRRHALPQPLVPFLRPAVAAAVRPAGMPLTLGALPDAALADRQSLALWAELLSRLPQARFVLAASRITDRSAERLLAPFAERGIAPGRVTVAVGADRMAVLLRTDLLLDGLLSGTAADALAACQAGVPVVATCGDRQARRRTAGILAALGRNELVAEGGSAAVLRIAAELAATPARLAAYRSLLPAAVAQAGLADPARIMARLEEALLAIWQDAVRATRG